MKGERMDKGKWAEKGHKVEERSKVSQGEWSLTNFVKLFVLLNLIFTHWFHWEVTEFHEKNIDKQNNKPERICK